MWPHYKMKKTKRHSRIEAVCLRGEIRDYNVKDS